MFGLTSIHSWNISLIRLCYMLGLSFVAGYLLILLGHGYFYFALEDQQNIAFSAFAGSVIITLLLLARQYSLPAVFVIFILMFFSIGLWYATHILNTQRHHRFSPESHSSSLWLYGYADDFIRTDPQGERFFFTASCRVSTIHKDLLTKPCAPDKHRQNLRVYVRHYVESASPASAIKPGIDGWIFVTLREPRGFANPAGFDWGKWLFVERVYAAAVMQCDALQPCWYPVASSHFILSLRHRISQWLVQVLPPGAAREILPALWIDDRSHMSAETREILTVFGLVHLVSISGFHITLIAAIGYWLGNQVWFLIGWRFVTCMGGRQIIYATLGATIFALIYAALAGFNVPTMRALIMVWVVGWSRCFKKSNILWPSYWLSFLICVLAFPLSPLTIGFWLSFIAVAILLKIFMHRWPPYKSWQALVRAQLLITLGLMPFSLAIQHWHWSSLWINAIAIPVTEILIMPLSLIWAFGSAVGDFLPTNIHNFWVNIGALIFHECFEWIFDELSAYQNHIQLIKQSAGLRWWSFSAVFLLLVMIFFLPWQKIIREKIRYVGIGFCLLLMSQLKPESPLFGQAVVSVLDVGQGLAVVVQTQNHVLLYDTGDQWSLDHDAGNSILLPYLHWLGIKQLDVMLLSHADKDHIGGAKSILHHMPIKKLMGVSVEHRTAHPCYRGQNWQWDSVRFEILSPKIHSAYTVDNNLSCVLKITDTHRSFLLTGDIERLTEENLLKEMRASLKADILLAPHHGSRTSSTSGFIDAVSPQWVIFSAGYRHRFGHPHNEVTSRYAARAVKMLNTAEQGAVIWNNETPITWRQRFHWAWY